MFLTSYLDFTKTIIPLALMASESIAHSDSSNNCQRAFHTVDHAI